MLTATDAQKTYRYLRIGMVGAVVLLATAVLVEVRAAGCWQTSISAYYYTPVRAIFVGVMFGIGLALIAIKGKSSVEDTFLNVAGMFAPLVAVAPTTNVAPRVDGSGCWSIPPQSFPVQDGELASWVVSAIDNNVPALLITAGLGLVLGYVLSAASNGSVLAPLTDVERGTVISLLAAGGLVLLVWWAYVAWADFYAEAHGLAALALFIALFGAVVAKAFALRDERSSWYFRAYAATATGMVCVAVVATVVDLGEHAVLLVEAAELVLFAVFWLVQTKERWDEVPPARRSTTSSER